MTDADRAHGQAAALVTGGRRGIGRGIAFCLAERGFDVAVNDIEDDAALASTLAGIRSRGARACAVVGDVANSSAHQGMIERAVAELGRLDCLVNNAGVSVRSRGDLLAVSEESYDRCLDTNLRGTFFLTQAFARYLLDDRTGVGHHRSIVSVSSVNADAVSIDRGEYCLSKTGLSMMTKLFALRLADSGIGVYEVKPGIIATDMTAPAKDKYDRLVAEGGVPMPRWGQPEDIGRAVAALASGALPYCVGQAVAIDGGLGLVRL